MSEARRFRLTYEVEGDWPNAEWAFRVGKVAMHGCDLKLVGTEYVALDENGEPIISDDEMAELLGPIEGGR